MARLSTLRLAALAAGLALSAGVGVQQSAAAPSTNPGGFYRFKLSGTDGCGNYPQSCPTYRRCSSGGGCPEAMPWFTFGPGDATECECGEHAATAPYFSIDYSGSPQPTTKAIQLKFALVDRNGRPLKDANGADIGEKRSDWIASPGSTDMHEVRAVFTGIDANTGDFLVNLCVWTNEPGGQVLEQPAQVVRLHRYP